MSRVVPVPTPETQHYWDRAAEQELWLPHCDACARYVFYPRTPCPTCGSDKLGWQQLSGRGTLASFVINHRAAPGYEDDAPYVIALVELEEGPRLTANLLDVDPTPEAVSVGMPLEVGFEQRDEIWLPQFRRRTEGAGHDA
ncbi:Zn-ribbon domain-containing OB-fold protein [Nocardioides sp.]|uniref:Zn-ribbon domain-containing OB-fold protein n=1 Tax=Nocardioides sp. TaxID=35761 RepID=UPI0027360585|nr:Zn-ribbon domain-containing OB-fold protein [Nocardioides sp.]MDP3893356.1 Zn-ribbon domain-containing OB-fold protein [Nocardioides sp.]